MRWYSKHGCMAFACLAGQSKLVAIYVLQAGMLYDTAFFFFFLRKQDLLIFEVLHGMAVIHDAGSSVFKKLISDFNVSLVDVNISGRKETGRGERYRKELFTHAQRIELIL